MSETISIYTNKVTTEPDTGDQLLVTLNNVEVDDIVPQFNAEELLQAIADHSDFSTVYDWAIRMKGEDDADLS